MKNILITGGAGFIGSHLCKRLLENGDRIICLDNLFTGNKENIASLLDNKNFEFIEHDITRPFFTETKIDQVYNLACPASPVHYQYNPIKTVKTSVLGTMNFFRVGEKKQNIMQDFSRRPQVKFMEIQMFTLRQKATGVM